jgi:hypothetical protein
VQEFNAVNLVFAGILLFSSFKLLQGDDDEDEDLSNNYIVKTCSKLINSTGDWCSCKGSPPGIYATTSFSSLG